MTGAARSTVRRLGALMNTGMFLAAVVTLALVACYFAFRPEARLTVDATKTRAYSLSDSTRQLLAALQGRWTIALMLVEDDVDAATRRQVDEVLRRYEQASDAIEVVRIDPSEPETLVEYDALLARLRAAEQDAVDRYELAVRDGRSAFATFQEFARDQVLRLEPLQARASGTAAEDIVRQIMTLLGLVASEGGQVLELIDESMAVSDGQPIPSYDVARSVLAEALTQWGDQLYEMSDRLAALREAEGVDPAVGAYASAAADAFRALSRRLAEVADPLATLPDLELAVIGRKLQGGEALVVIGPRRAAVVPSEQLFPNIGVRELTSETVAFDRRFRGEQVISATIRSTQVPVMPMVVFVHAEGQSLLRASDRHADLVGVASMLRAARYEVREWSVGTTQRPSPPRDQPVVWCVVPPLRRASLEPEQREIALVRAVEELVADGEPVLLNVNPSLLPRYRQVDPWQRVPAPFGLRPATGTPLFEAVPGRGGAMELLTSQRLAELPGEHPVCRAVHGQALVLGLPVPIEPRADAPADVRTWTVVDVSPSPRRWLEGDWAARLQAPGPGGQPSAEPGPPLTDAAAVVVAAERRHPLGQSTQRVILVGSGGWMLSAVADAVTDIGGGRVVLNQPGNQELLLASVAWLAGLDDLIATSPLSQQVARLDGIDKATSVRWAIVAVVLTPLACLLAGACVTVRRRLSR